MLRRPSSGATPSRARQPAAARAPGAAWATLFARLVVLFPLIYLCIRRFGLFGAGARTRPDGDVIRSIWRLGWPSSTQLVLRIAAMLVTHSLVARLHHRPGSDREHRARHRLPT